MLFNKVYCTVPLLYLQKIFYKIISLVGPGYRSGRIRIILPDPADPDRYQCQEY
jgi:hypothetical protein